MRNLDKIEDKDIQENREPNLELKLLVQHINEWVKVDGF